ncbi:hypothetical protein HQ571_04515 [Candidatus Kuenenbacteria bacterium]|nr:hypothetical protein [Candidatus Kuenenbacteria bacterium]
MQSKQTKATSPEANLPQPEVVPVDVEKEIKVEEQPQVENAPEKAVADEQAEQVQAVAPVQVTEDQAVPTAPEAEPKSEDLVQIETILSEGLEDLYKELPENRQTEFKQKGEETARGIESLLNSAKVKMNKVVDMIKSWLKMIPGVNKYFLEQSSKIKADRLQEYKEDQKKGGV